MKPSNPPERGSQPIPVVAYDERKARDAYQVHAALLTAENRDARLKQNPQWTMLRQDAYEAFCRAFEQ